EMTISQPAAVGAARVAGRLAGQVETTSQERHRQAKGARRLLLAFEAMASIDRRPRAGDRIPACAALAASGGFGGCRTQATRPLSGGACGRAIRRSAPHSAPLPCADYPKRTIATGRFPRLN